MAVVIDDRQMAYVECGDKDPDNATTKGWDCLFRPMPHLCTFDTDVVRDLAQMVGCGVWVVSSLLCEAHGCGERLGAHRQQVLECSLFA